MNVVDRRAVGVRPIGDVFNVFTDWALTTATIEENSIAPLTRQTRFLLLRQCIARPTNMIFLTVSQYCTAITTTFRLFITFLLNSVDEKNRNTLTLSFYSKINSKIRRDCKGRSILFAKQFQQSFQTCLRLKFFCFSIIILQFFFTSRTEGPN